MLPCPRWLRFGSWVCSSTLRWALRFTIRTTRSSEAVRAAAQRWLAARPRDWLAGVATVAVDPWRGYASALLAPLGHARVVVDHFHAIRLANMVVDQTRPADPAGHPGPPGPQARPAVPHPQAAADRARAAHRTGTSAATGRLVDWGSQR